MTINDTFNASKCAPSRQVSSEPLWQPEYGLTWDEGELTELELFANLQGGQRSEVKPLGLGIGHNDERLPKPANALAAMNGHTPPGVGVSAAHRAARKQLSEFVSALMTAEPGDCAEVLDDAAYRIGALVGHGFLDRSDAADALTQACVANGFTAEAGPDVVQEAISSGFVEGGRAAKAEIEAAERTSEKEESHSDVTTPDMSIVFRNKLPAPVFPIEILGFAAGWVQRVAAIKNAPIDYVALGLFATAASMIGPKRRVQAWDGWEEPSIIWAILVGDPSLIKSPSLDPYRDAVRTIERELNANFEERKARYEDEKVAALARKEEWKRQVKAADRDNVVPPPMPKEAMEPKQPTQVRVWISDITTEKMARLLGENPDGLVNFRDEIAGLFGSFDKYGGSGSDKSLWLETYGGRPHRYDRVSLDESIDIPFCAVSLVGCIQPDRLNSMVLSGDDDGLAARPLYAWPDAVRPRRPIETVDRDILLAVLRRLRNLAFDTDGHGNPQPRVKPLSSEAMFEFTGWWEHKQWDAKRAAGGRIAGAIGKLDGIALRLAQVIELLEWAWSGSNQPEPEQISVTSIQKALHLIDSWVRATLERVFAEASLPKAERNAMIVGRWLLKTRPKTVNARDLRRQPGFPGPKEPKDLDAALEILVDARWLKPPPTDGPGRAPGRPRKDYEVNILIYEETAKS
jgi:hypothetical protein